MCTILDFTVGTVGDLVGFKGQVSSKVGYKDRSARPLWCRHLNTSTPLSMTKYDAVWKN